MLPAPMYACPFFESADNGFWPAPRAVIHHFPWEKGGYRPYAWAQAVWQEDALHIRLFCRESTPRTTFANPNDPVYRDSCLEFFVMRQGDNHFFHLEMNSAGVLLAGINHGGKIKLIPEAQHVSFIPRVLPCSDGWAVQLKVPFSLFGLPNAALWSNKPVFRCNFYKCGDDTPFPHYGCWSAVSNPEPQFHDPASFGWLMLIGPGAKDKNWNGLDSRRSL